MAQLITQNPKLNLEEWKANHSGGIPGGVLFIWDRNDVCGLLWNKTPSIQKEKEKKMSI